MSNTDYLLSWHEFHNDTRKLAQLLLAKQDASNPWSGIVAIARGGLIPGAILARELNLHYVDTLCIASYDHTEQGKIRILKSLEGDGEGLLLVDDLVDSGNTAKIAREILPKAHFACVYAKPAGMPLAQSYVREFPQDTWLHFPWDSELIDGKSSYCEPIADQTNDNS